MAKTKAHEIPPSVLDEVRRNLARLKLDAMLAGLDAALEQAARAEQGYVTFLAGLVQLQLLATADRASELRMRAACLPSMKTFDGFDWAFQPGLNVALAKDLMNLHFISQHRPVLILGKPGTGKTHLATAYGVLAAQSGYSVRYYAVSRLCKELYAALADSTTDRLISRLGRIDFLILDDLRALPPKTDYAALLSDLIEARHGRKSTLVTSNLSVSAWGKALGNHALTTSLVDRLMEKAHVLNIKRGRSYRCEGPDAPPESDRPDGLVQEPSEEP